MGGGSGQCAVGSAAVGSVRWTVGSAELPTTEVFWSRSDRFESSLPTAYCSLPTAHCTLPTPHRPLLSFAADGNVPIDDRSGRGFGRRPRGVHWSMPCANQQPQTDFEFFGATGALMRAAGVEPIVRSDDLAILGLLEIGRALPKFWKAYKLLKQAAIERKPDAVILVDWPDFNLKLARALHRRGIKVIYYISPQLWAWRSYRARSIQRDVDLLLSILPFEKDWYAERGIEHVEYVGHPLAREVSARVGPRGVLSSTQTESAVADHCAIAGQPPEGSGTHTAADAGSSCAHF